MMILGVVFCLVLLAILGVSFYLRRQTLAYVKLGAYQTNRFMSCELTFEEYAKLRKETRESVNPLLQWYMRKVGILDD